MEKKKRENSVLTRAAELFDLPADLVAGLPHVEVVGSGHFYLENHRGILSYSGEEIDINGEGMVIRVFGAGEHDRRRPADPGQHTAGRMGEVTCSRR